MHNIHKEIIFCLKARSLRGHYAQALAPAFQGLYTDNSPFMKVTYGHRIQDQNSISNILNFLGPIDKEKKVAPAP